MHRALFVPSIDEPKILIGHDIQSRENMVSGKRENGVHALVLEGLGQEMAAGNSPGCAHPHLRNYRNMTPPLCVGGA